MPIATAPVATIVHSPNLKRARGDAGGYQQTRSAERVAVALPARLTWRDQRGATRFASVITRNVSEFGVYVECQPGVSIPLYRLVQFQLERDARESDALPATLCRGRVLSAVYRVSKGTVSGAPAGLALRLMVEPKRGAATVEDTRATA
ncbi:MAG TPA: hypothetical protein VG222_18595 [Vicinamibacterales bacterium]|nr:hypothetical protein [Vicinamibacterales bacterium]